MNNPTLGIDISSGSFVAALWLTSGKTITHEFANHTGGFQALCTWLRQHFAAAARVGIESTNVYGDALAAWMHAAGHEVFMLNPLHVAHYARSQGQRNKTDHADAVTVAKFTAQYRGMRWRPPTPQQQHLRSLTRTRAALVEQHTVLKNQLKTSAGPGRVFLERVAEKFAAEIKAVDRAISAYVASDPTLSRRVAFLRTLKGIGVLTAAVLLAELPPIGRDADARAICAWAGLIPRRRQSGKLELPTRISRQGNAFVRQCLYMPALVAKRWNPLFRLFTQRLAQRGKSTQAILGAIAHKMLRIIVGMLRSDRPFDPLWQRQKT